MRAKRNAAIDADQPSGPPVGQRLHQRCIHEGKNRDAGAQAQPQHHNGGRGESRILAQLPHGKTQVLRQVVEQVPSAHIAALLLPLCQARSRNERRPPRFGGVHPAGYILFDLPLDVVAQLLIQFDIQLPPLEH